MKILVLNGGPRPHGNTAVMVEAFAKGAQENGHQADVANVCQKKLPGVLPANTATKKDSGHERQCIQQDDMQAVYPLLDEAEMIACWLRRFITMVLPVSCSAPSTASMRWINQSA